ncbi:RYamide receptor-like [Haliotis rubra]|uniref:RYamide receptor-like n=1 Tax=Haliotis rubra TaxID=36100 RepID=UPI001EE62F77|nr:RYamide receptor-like [Haliotis rubra]
MSGQNNYSVFLQTTELFTNASGAPQGDSSVSLTVTIILVLMYILTILVAVSGNLAVCYIILSDHRMRTVTNLFLLTLALSDIIKAVICNPFSVFANLKLYWPFGSVMCPVWQYLQVVAVYVSSLTLVAMSLDRFVAILFPLKPRMSKSRLLVIIVLILFLSCALPLPTAIKSKVTFPKPQFPNDPSSNGLCLEKWDNDFHKYVYSMGIMVTQYFLPLSVLAFTNGCIGYVVWIKKPPGEADSGRDNRLAASKRRMVKMIIVVVVIYAVCWLPLHVLTLVGDRDQSIYNNSYMNVVFLAIQWLATSHSCYNPFVYFWMNPKFRNGFKRMLRFIQLRKMKEKDVNVPFHADHLDREASSHFDSCGSRYYHSTRTGSSNHVQGVDCM